jgi:hypothetical protein
MDTYSIFKAAKIAFRQLLKEHNPIMGDYELECESNDWANEVVQITIKEGMMYPFSELNKPKETYYPIIPTSMY